MAHRWRTLCPSSTSPTTSLSPLSHPPLSPDTLWLLVEGKRTICCSSCPVTGQQPSPLGPLPHCPLSQPSRPCLCVCVRTRWTSVPSFKTSTCMSLFFFLRDLLMMIVHVCVFVCVCVCMCVCVHVCAQRDSVSNLKQSQVLCRAFLWGPQTDPHPSPTPPLAIGTAWCTDTPQGG